MLSGTPPACPLSIFWSRVCENLPPNTTIIVGRLRIVSLFRSKKAPFYHEYVVAGFGEGNQAPTSWIRVERAAQINRTPYETLTDSHGPLFRGVARRETLSVSGSKQRLSQNSNELACITIQNSAENFIDVRSMVHQMMSTSNTNILYQLFTANCRWFARRGFLNILQWCEVAKIPHSATWKDTPASTERLQSKLEQERFGGAKIMDGRGRGLNHRNMLNLVQAQLGWDGSRLTKDTFDLHLRELETASLEPNERAVLMADILTKSAYALFSTEPKAGLIDAERAVAMMRAVPLDAYRREEQLAWSLAALSNCLRETGRALEAITVMDEAISIDREELGINSQLSVRLVEQALNFRAAEKFEEEANSLKESLQILDSLGLDGQWSDKGDFRVDILRAYAVVLIKLGRHQDALTAQRESVAILRDLQPRNREGNPEGFATELLGLAALAFGEEEYDEAIAAAREAVSLYRKLPSARGLMPRALKILGGVFEAQSCHDAAAAAHAEAVVIQRELGGPDARTQLGQLLMLLSDSHRNAGEMGAALEAAQDAVDVLRTDWLEHNGDDDKTLALSWALTSCVVILQDLGRIDDAVRFLGEDIELARSQGTDSVEHRSELADKLQVLAIRYADLGRAEDALRTAADSTDVYRSVLATTGSATSRVALRDAVLRYAGFLSRFGDGQRASDAISEAVLLGGSLEADEGHISALLQHMVHQLDSDAHAEALETVGSALRICSVDLPDRRDLLELVIRAHERVFDELGRPAEAAARQEEVLTIWRENMDPDSPNDTSLLAQGLERLAKYYHGSGNLSEALLPIQDGVDIHGALWARDKTDAEKGKELTVWLARRASILFQLGRKTEATASLDEETDVLRVLLSESPSFTLEMVIEAAQQRRIAAMQHVVEGRPDDAMDSARQYLLLSRVAYSGHGDTTSQAESLSQALVGYVMLIVMFARDDEVEEAAKIMVEALLLSPDVLKTVDPTSLLPLPN